MKTFKMAAVALITVASLSACNGKFHPGSDHRTIYFSSGKATLDGAARKEIADIAATYPDMTRFNMVEGDVRLGTPVSFKLVGSTDTVGNQEANKKLSKKRVCAVRTALRKAGFNNNAIFTVAKGEKHLAVKTNDGVNKKANRRVDIYISR